MKEYKKILVPFDGSPYSRLALEHAVYLAGEMKSSVTVLYVASLTSAMTRINGFFGSYDAGAIAKKVQQKGDAVLREAKNVFLQRSRWMNYLKSAHPGRSLSLLRNVPGLIWSLWERAVWEHWQVSQWVL